MKYLTALVLLILFNCNPASPTESDPLLGKWLFRHSLVDNMSEWTGKNITFKSDGTCVWGYTVYRYSKSVRYIVINDVSYTYTVNETTLRLNDKPDIYQYYKE